MTIDAFSRLTELQRTCLRGYAALKSAKEIGAEFDPPKSQSTIYGHLDAAVKVLSARDRRDAALAFQAFERGAHPQVWTGPISRVDPDPDPQPPTPQPFSTWSRWLPIRPKGAKSNDLSPAVRLAWIPLGAVLIAIGFGAVVNGLSVLGGIFERLWHLFR